MWLPAKPEAEKPVEAEPAGSAELNLPNAQRGLAIFFQLFLSPEVRGDEEPCNDNQHQGAGCPRGNKTRPEKYEVIDDTPEHFVASCYAWVGLPKLLNELGHYILL